MLQLEEAPNCPLADFSVQKHGLAQTACVQNESCVCANASHARELVNVTLEGIGCFACEPKRLPACTEALDQCTPESCACADPTTHVRHAATTVDGTPCHYCEPLHGATYAFGMSEFMIAVMLVSGVLIFNFLARKSPPTGTTKGGLRLARRQGDCNRAIRVHQEPLTWYEEILAFLTDMFDALVDGACEGASALWALLRALFSGAYSVVAYVWAFAGSCFREVKQRYSAAGRAFQCPRERKRSAAVGKGTDGESAEAGAGAKRKGRRKDAAAPSATAPALLSAPAPAPATELAPAPAPVAAAVPTVTRNAARTAAPTAAPMTSAAAAAPATAGAATGKRAAAEASTKTTPKFAPAPVPAAARKPAALAAAGGRRDAASSCSSAAATSIVAPAVAVEETGPAASSVPETKAATELSLAAAAGSSRPAKRCQEELRRGTAAVENRDAPVHSATEGTPASAAGAAALAPVATAASAASAATATPAVRSVATPASDLGHVAGLHTEFLRKLSSHSTSSEGQGGSPPLFVIKNGFFTEPMPEVRLRRTVSDSDLANYL